MRVRAYTGTAKLLHWLVALLALAMIGIGFVMRRLELPLAVRFELYQLHKSIGFVVLALMLIRLLWRARHAPPPLPLELSRFTRALAHSMHVVLYALLIMLPLTGWMMVSLATLPIPTRLFGVVEVPHIAPLASMPAVTKAAWEQALKEVHMMTAYTLLALVTLHVLAALHHHFWRRDDVLRRMLPGRRHWLGALLLVAAGASVLHASSMSVAAKDRASVVRWQLDQAASRLQFELDVGGQGFTGRFKSFTASIVLDPADPGSLDVVAHIETGSVETGTRDVDIGVREAAWLDVANHPSATFRATGARREADGRLITEGRLLLKGMEQPVRLSFTLTAEGPRLSAVGGAVVRRSLFRIGPSGPIAGLVIGDEVRIRLDLVAQRIE